MTTAPSLSEIAPHPAVAEHVAPNETVNPRAGAKKVFSAVKAKIRAEAPPETHAQLHKAAVDILDYATEWPPGTEFGDGVTFDTAVGSEVTADGRANRGYQIKRINEQGDFVGVGFDGKEVPLKRADLVAETVNRFPKNPDGTIDAKQLAIAIPNEQARNYLIALLEAQKTGQMQVGEVVDMKVVVEAAKSMGFFTPDTIYAMAKGMVGPDGNALLSEADIKLLNGEAIPSTKKADGTETPAPTLSETGKKLQEKLGDSLVLDVDQVRDALGVLEIPTGKGDLARMMSDDQKALAQLEDDLSKTTVAAGNNEQLAAKHAMEKQAEELRTRMRSRATIIDQLNEDLGNETFDPVGEYFKMLEAGEGNAEKLKNFTDALIKPDADNLAALDDSYEERKGVHLSDVEKKKKKEFFKKLAMNGGLGLAGLMAIQLWRASKKDER